MHRNVTAGPRSFSNSVFSVARLSDFVRSAAFRRKFCLPRHERDGQVLLNRVRFQRGIAASPLASDQGIVVKDSLEDILSNRSRGVLPRKFNA